MGRDIPNGKMRLKGKFLDIDWKREELARFGLSIDEAQSIVQNAAGGSQNDTSIAGGNKPTFGDVVELLALFKPDTSAEIHQVKNGGAES